MKSLFQRVKAFGDEMAIRVVMPRTQYGDTRLVRVDDCFYIHHDAEVVTQLPEMLITKVRHGAVCDGTQCEKLESVIFPLSSTMLSLKHMEAEDAEEYARQCVDRRLRNSVKLWYPGVTVWGNPEVRPNFSTDALISEKKPFNRVFELR